MATVRVVCWDAELARERERLLEKAGFSVDASEPRPSGLITRLQEMGPAAVVIDLDRLPSHGREVAVALRGKKATRGIPIVFAGGAAEKVERIRRELPDAVFTNWGRAATAVRKAIRQPPANPVAPTPHMQRYAGSSLVKKLGLRPQMRVAILAAPEGFEETLGELPEGVAWQAGIGRGTQLSLWFVRSARELEAETSYLAARLPQGASLWIIHPKQTGRFKVDFNQNDVRAAGLEAGLVDYKVCAVDSDWSGLKFTHKK